MEKAKHSWLLSNGVSVVAGDKVEVITKDDNKKYIGVIIDISDNHILCDLVNELGELDVFFYEVEDIQLVK